MDKSRTGTTFVCQQCGKESLKWLGRCPSCQQWNTFVEKMAVAAATSFRSISPVNPPQELSQVVIEAADRFPLPLAEFNRVLGGGLVSGSLVLIGGDPGIGKSTLLLQVSAVVAQARGRVVYVSGEETLPQIKLRSGRLGVKGEKLYLLAETNLEVILNQVEQLQPSLVVIDSIQAVYLPELEAAPGSITQVRECTMRLMHWAKLSAVPVFITGHVTKDGAIAGPRGLERRTANGVDFGRLLMITAVLTRRVGLKLGNQDIIANVTGGLRIGEPAADLGIALSVASSFRDVGVDPQLVVVGEVGLSGELRAVSQLDRRVAEAARLGFKRCLVPEVSARVSPAPKDIELIPVSTLREAIGVGLVRAGPKSKTEPNLG